MNGLGEGHEFVEHLRALVELCIVGTVLVEHSDSLTVCALSVGITLSRPINVAQT